jgi:uracil-DNA glycosylase
MPSLRHALGTYLDNWRADVPAHWRPWFNGVEPDLSAVAPHLTLNPGEVIIPGRKGQLDPRAPKGSHLFRALDDCRPEDVRAVLLGQDPYPKVLRATGRSFEQGDLKAWDGDVAESLRRILQTLAQHRLPNSGYVAHDKAWPGTLAGILAHQPALEDPPDLFDRWSAAGVLCLNLGLTLSRFDKKNTPAANRVQPAHMNLWRPVVAHLLTRLVQRPGKSLVVMLWGKPAKDAFAAMQLAAAAAAAGSRLLVVQRSHPGAEGPPGNEGAAPFLTLPTPFTEANTLLHQHQLPPIAW